MEKNIAIRSCIVCKTKTNKENLNRVVLVDGKLLIDNKKQHNSRGAYVCGSVECLNSLKKSKAFNRSFKKNISDEAYDELIEALNGKK